MLIAQIGFCQLNFDDWVKKGNRDKYILPMLGNTPWTTKENEFIQLTLTQFNNKSEASKHFIDLGNTDRRINVDLEAAMRNFNKAWLLDTTNSDVYFFFGDMYLTFFGETERAKAQGLEFLDKGFKFNSKNSSILARKGGVYLDEFKQNDSLVNKLNDATELLLKSFEISPNHASAYQLTRCYYFKNDCANAKKFLNETIERGGKGYTEALSKRIENKCSEHKIKLPSVDKIWGLSEYKIALDYLNSLPGYDLPKLSDKESVNVFYKITSYENLKIYADKSLSPDERFKEVYPYFNLFPEILSIYTKANLDNEAVIISQFIMESLKMSTYLAQDKLNDWSETKRKQFKAGFSEQIHTMTSGSLGVISVAEEENIDKVYIIAFATWFKDNFTILYNWLDDSGKAACKAEIKSLSKKGSPKEIKKLMKDLESRLN